MTEVSQAMPADAPARSSVSRNIIPAISIRWLAGSVLGTAIIWLVSPWLVRSYVPRVFDDARQVWVLQPGSDFRWRREGFATTRVGAHGMMGRHESAVKSAGVTSRPSDSIESMTIALWGDSQAEGVCVDDENKIANLIQATLGETVDVLPLARSGDSGWDWVHQMPHVQTNLSVDGHAFVISELSDLVPLQDPQPESIPGLNSSMAGFSWAIEFCPDFVVHAGRKVLLDAAGQRRRLRMSVGTSKQSKSSPSGLVTQDHLCQLDANSNRVDWNRVVQRFDVAENRP
ncbi:MAG: hypothetical protein AAF539_05415, partial [Planctomycetota bacterium]